MLTAVVMGVALLVRMLFTRDFDYDEISHAHMAWLVSIGEKPYQDFAANHFPFFWILMSPVMWLLPKTPVALIVLRLLALICNGIFLVALARLICLELRPGQRIWALACLGVIVFSPLTMWFLIEFRPDPFANALLFSALLWLRTKEQRTPWSWLAGGFLLGLAVLINTKYLALPFVLGGVLLFGNRSRLRRMAPIALVITAGFGLAILTGIMALLALRISLSDAWLMVVAYNGAVERSQTNGFGLARILVHSWFVWWFIFPGLIACLLIFARSRKLPKSFEVAFFVFLAINLLTTTRPWKQYIASWLLLAAGLPARSLPVFVERFSRPLQSALAVLLLMFALIFDVLAYHQSERVTSITRDRQDRVMAYLLQHVPEDGFVATTYYMHPVFRKDTFFKTVFDAEGDGRDGLEDYMPQLSPEDYSRKFEQSGYAIDIEQRPPSVIVIQNGYTPAQNEALLGLIRRSAQMYREVTIPGTSVTILELSSLAKADQEASSVGWLARR